MIYAYLTLKVPSQIVADDNLIFFLSFFWEIQWLDFSRELSATWKVKPYFL